MSAWFYETSVITAGKLTHNTTRLIWIETDHSWFVLCEPDASYAKQYKAFTKKHLSLQLLCSLAAHSKSTLDDFYRAMKKEILHGRECQRDDLLEFVRPTLQRFMYRTEIS